MTSNLSCRHHNFHTFNDRILNGSLTSLWLWLRLGNNPFTVVDGVHKHKRWLQQSTVLCGATYLTPTPNFLVIKPQL